MTRTPSSAIGEGPDSFAGHYGTPNLIQPPADPNPIDDPEHTARGGQVTGPYVAFGAGHLVF